MGIQRKPQINANDTPFTADLKRAISGLMDEQKRLRLTGDGVTFRVSAGVDGTKGHAIMPRRVLLAKLTDNNDDGTYDAVEVEWDAGASAWVTKTGGVTWDGTAGNQEPLLELAGTDDLDDAVTANQIVIAVHTLTDDREPLWVFEALVGALALIPILVKAPEYVLGKDEDGLIGWAPTGLCT